MEASDEKLRLLNTLLQKGLVSGRNPADLAATALELIIEDLTIIRGEIFYLDPDNMLQMMALAGYDDSNLSQYETKLEQRLQQALVDRVLKTSTGVTIPDVNCQEYWLPIPGLDDDICSVAALPLKTDQEILGIMTLLSSEMGYFTEDQLPVLSAVAAAVALVLHNARLFYQVQTGQAQLRKLAEQMVEAQEKERRQISQTLHDEMGQMLTVLQMSLDAIEHGLPPRSPLIEKLAEVNRHLADIMYRIRRLSYSLRPPELDTIGLNAALNALCEEITQHADFSVTYVSTDEPPTLPENIRISFYRCLQEALTNVVRHTHATEVEVKFGLDGQHVRLSVRDNGQGLASRSLPQTPPSGLGLLGMRERFESLGGSLVLDSSSDAGTILVAAVPLEIALHEAQQ